MCGCRRYVFSHLILIALLHPVNKQTDANPVHNLLSYPKQMELLVKRVYSSLIQLTRFLVNMSQPFSTTTPPRA